MRVLILGGTGMVGHKLWQVLSKEFDTWATVRALPEATVKMDLPDMKRVVENVDALDFDSIIRAVATVRPDVAVNAIGIIKQKPDAKNAVASIKINSLLPHQLAVACKERGIRLIHISTDCVFSGRKGMYTEEDPADAEDLYGRSKLLGEVTASDCLTLRTSFIGPELSGSAGLLAWFLTNVGKSVRGYTQAVFSGFPTVVFANILADIIAFHPKLTGLYHVSAEPIDKYSLLCLLREAYNIPIEVEPFSQFRIDRSLDSRRFRSATGFTPLSWPEMIATMAADFSLNYRRFYESGR